MFKKGLVLYLVLFVLLHSCAARSKNPYADMPEASGDKIASTILDTFIKAGELGGFDIQCIQGLIKIVMDTYAAYNQYLKDEDAQAFLTKMFGIVLAGRVTFHNCGFI